MRPKLLLMLSLICLLSSCKNGPKVSVCISDPASGGFSCFDEQTGKSFFVAYEASDKYVAFSPSDAQALLSFCGER